MSIQLNAAARLNAAKGKKVEITKDALKDSLKAFKFKVVDEEKDRVHFEYKGNEFSAIIRKGQVDLIVQGNGGDLEISSELTLDEIPALVKSINRKWFKEYDPDYQ